VLAERQEELLARIAKMREENKELADAQVFSLAHQRVASAGRQVVDALREATIPQGLPQRQLSIERVLRQLVAALGEDQQQDEQFREPEGGGGGGGGGGQGSPPLIPPIAQLKLLRSMQEEALELTRQADAPGTEKLLIEQLASEARELQAQVAKQGEELLKALQEQGGQSPGVTVPGTIGPGSGGPGTPRPPVQRE